MNKMRLLFGAALILLLMGTTGCSFSTIPPATKGKILTTSGYSPDILEPGKITLLGRDKLILIDTSTKVYTESIPVVLRDKLTITVDVRFRGRISDDNDILNAMFNDITDGGDGLISFNEVYRVYGRMIVRNKTREVIGQYSVEDVHKNYSRLSKEIADAMQGQLSKTPVMLSQFSLGKIQYPKVVTEAIDAAKARELAIAKEQAQAEIELTKKKNEKRLAEADYQIEITRAKAIRDKNKIIGEGVTPQLIQLRRLEVMEKLAQSGSSVFIPYESMAGVGPQMLMYQQKQNK